MKSPSSAGMNDQFYEQLEYEAVVKARDDGDAIERLTQLRDWADGRILMLHLEQEVVHGLR